MNPKLFLGFVVSFIIFYILIEYIRDLIFNFKIKK